MALTLLYLLTCFCIWNNISVWFIRIDAQHQEESYPKEILSRVFDWHLLKQTIKLREDEPENHKTLCEDLVPNLCLTLATS